MIRELIIRGKRGNLYEVNVKTLNFISSEITFNTLLNILNDLCLYFYKLENFMNYSSDNIEKICLKLYSRLVRLKYYLRCN